MSLVIIIWNVGKLPFRSSPLKLWETLQQTSLRTLFPKQKKFHFCGMWYTLLAEQPSGLASLLLFFDLEGPLAQAIISCLLWHKISAETELPFVWCNFYLCNIHPCFLEPSMVQECQCSSTVLCRNARQRLGSHRFECSLHQGFSGCF